MSQSEALRVVRPNPWIGAAVYTGLLVAGIGIFLLICRAGSGLTVPAASDTTAAASGAIRHEPVNIVLHVLGTLAAVIFLGSLLGKVCRRLGQPPVIGEVLAGIMLGPSLLGAISPEAMHVLIPSATTDPKGQVTSALKAVSQIGVVLYMFLVGLELNAARLRKQAHAAVAVSHASIVVPFVLGSALALGLYKTLAPAGTTFLSFALFMGVAMSITAFPVLARILTDRRMSRTELGVVALSCAAADDVTAWCLLALIVGVAQSKLSNVAAITAGAAAFIAVMFLIVRPLVTRLSARFDATTAPLPPMVISGTFLAVLLAAMTTEAIGIHALFGAFLCGAIVPHDGRIAREFTAKLKDPVTVLLLPAFFAYTGMRTQIGLVSSGEDWLWCAAIVVVATVGKFGGTLGAARLTGQSWRDAAALGALMNTRGLMELIVLNIGLDLGVISPTLFAMMVLMALITTAMTSPIVSLLVPPAPQEEPAS
ncbi:sodium hydrogen exchanger : Putative cation transporter/universal stress family protein OS=Stigmatella aurantiaca (strain DW4/3-1) GN=STAUR_1138 PE=4 SV=1: Na_H_Exchanger [Gemmata massiliana]|uniref:Cation/H+ exchanger transmembrane domain-containing protein n=1 Tax=Gemmata massiliana TaxID=1210884 RepID=A0A6P2D482_9BACT|nr:cation:proton antiporter [Gemmata massiliana]VTR94904.1 sodium hydrogen exchanger : Putative cation transporter/universal stress family protein OS=Stigmatella aurantiaca (strain DW4/3-1) GN=STAUR_1138 PE=4 SV=1: Na_H_Exchanger [Gemmata massiliana]